MRADPRETSFVWFQVQRPGLCPTHLERVNITGIDDLRTHIKNRVPVDIPCPAPKLHLKVGHPGSLEMIELDNSHFVALHGMNVILAHFRISQDNPIKVFLPEESGFYSPAVYVLYFRFPFHF
ncbi:hypothetical protein BC937DRAFT_94175 [Endogone sp. FLAS-F59071]|nr:hypothetical protein BC937DRAFT_94175 [Endogone sp. FLAS-F59071]|eukprot:RUS20863.1 hypothetical protein BC937DRAFT_94175 [Endogone sp. FLAS-F59071]